MSTSRDCNPLEASGTLWKVGAELPGVRKGEQKLAELGRSCRAWQELAGVELSEGWQGLAGAGNGWQGLAKSRRSWPELVGARRGWLRLARLARAGSGWQELAGAGRIRFQWISMDFNGFRWISMDLWRKSGGGFLRS